MTDTIPCVLAMTYQEALEILQTEGYSVRAETTRAPAAREQASGVCRDSRQRVIRQHTSQKSVTVVLGSTAHYIEPAGSD